MTRFAFSSLACALLLAGCAPTKPLISQEEVQAARQGGNLEAAYEQFATRLASQKADSPAAQAAQTQLREIGTQLAGKLEQDIRQDLNQYSTASGLVPLPVLDAINGKLARMERWDKERFLKLGSELAEARKKTTSRIDSLQKQRAQQDDNQMSQRMSTLADLALLTGDDRFSKERTDAMETLRKRAEEAFQAEQYGEAKKALQALQQIAPEDKQINTQLLQADARLFEKKFWDALGDGKLDDAYSQFMTIAQTPQFPEVAKRLSKSSNDMVDYFVAQAAAATTDNKFGDAYKLFSQARDIRLKLNPEATGVLPQEQTFCQQLFQRYQNSQKQGTPGIALGYLKIIETFNPEFPGLRGLLRTTTETVVSRATRKVSTAAFASEAGKAEFGGAIAAKVTQHLFDKIPNDLKLIERDQFQAILREKEIGASTAKSELVSADYLIQGKILESRVDTTEKASKKTMRVITETVTETNPEYDQWAALPEEKRRNRAEPARTLQRDKKEDVTINLNIVRKVGIISASYRLVEATTGKVLATGSETAKAEYTDEGNEGVELGNFHMPFKLPSLPSDTEIFDKLVGKISETIGDKLVVELQNPETRFVQTSQRYAEEGDFNAAAEQAAYAFTLATQKQQETTTLRRNLEKYSAQAQP